MAELTLSSHDLAAAPRVARPEPLAVLAAVQKRSFATLSTVSPAGHPHVAGVLYEAVGTTLYTSTLRSSRKARNVEHEGRVALVVPIRRLPFGPPATVQLQARATVLDATSPEIRAHVEAGRLRSITGHGELDLEDGCFLRIVPGRRFVTYGLGLSLWRLLRDPLSAGGHVEIDAQG